jgi:hypothetical protein
LEETGARLQTDWATNVAFCRLEVALGEAEWTAKQTLHFAASAPFEWWCAANASADQKVNSRHKIAIFFENNRMSLPQQNPFLDSTPKSEANATRRIAQPKM